MLPVSSSTPLRHVKDTSIESRGNIQASEASDFSKLLAAEVSGDDEVRDARTNELHEGAAANVAGNGLVIPGNPSLKGSEDMDSGTETEEGRSGTEGNMTAEMLAGGFQLSGPATITARPADMTDALHVPVIDRTSDTVTGIETRIPIGTTFQQQRSTAFDQRGSGADITPPSSATFASGPHLSAAGRIISPTHSIASGQAEADARASDLSRPAVEENAVSVALTMSPGMYLNSAAAGGSQEGQTTVRTASSGVVSAAGARFSQDTRFTGIATQDIPNSDSASSRGRRVEVPSRIGELLPDVSHLHQALPAEGSDMASPFTLAASVTPQELLSSPQPPSHPLSGPGTGPGIVDLPDHPFFRLEPNVGTGGWDNALGQRVLWMVSQQHQLAELNLNPPDLGPLQVVLSVNNDQASAAFVSQNPEVRQALEAALPRLKEMMAESGINLGNATVSDQGSRQQSDFERQNGGRSYYRHGESRIVAAGTSLGMNRGTAETGGHQLVDTFA
ncbi:MAG TPA: flagellar hook-length control protein FliK [Nitrosospira sp.]|nr:flagellar hook-length control protein FliK [Nitrosospira sp.]